MHVTHAPTHTEAGHPDMSTQKFRPMACRSDGFGPPQSAQVGRGLLAAVLCAMALMGAGCQSGEAVEAAPPGSVGLPARPAQRPNIIVIVADDLGFGDIGVNGGRIPTPNIDALAASGVRMVEGYTTAAVCAPSRAALMAGRQQTRFGFEFNPAGRDTQRGMSQQETTIAQTLGAAGYRTGIVGKWHLGQAAGYTPLDRGFDSFFGILGGATPYLTAIRAEDLHVETAEDRLITRDRLPVFDGRTRVEPEAYLTDVFTDRAIAFTQAADARPYFLYLAYTAPHTPLQAPARYVARVGEQPSDFHRAYAAMVIALDDGIGRLVRHLKETGAYENTMIIFLSDNGCASYVGGACTNAPLKGWKGYPWDGGIRVPFIVSWPGRLAPTVHAGPVSALDIAATAAAAAGTTHPGAEGHDLVALLQSSASRPDRALFWRMGPTRIVRDGRWKLIIVNRAAPTASGAESDDLARSMRPDGIPAVVSELGQWTLLYDLEADPTETVNLAERRPDVVRDLQAKWERWDAANVPPQWTSRRGVAAEVDGMRVEMFN